MRRIIVLWVLAACAAAACSRQEAGWKDAAREDSIASYRQYLERFPAGAHAIDARGRVFALQEEEAWAHANRLRTPEAWQRYLGEWPDGRHSALARRQLVAFIPPSTAGGSAEATGFMVQLGAYSSADAARAALEQRMQEYPLELPGLAARVIAPSVGEPALWRIRAGPFDEGTARELCAKLAASGAGCLPVAEGSAGKPQP